MKLNWFMRRLKFKASSPKRRPVLRAGGVFVPRLEPLEDRSLPSSYPTVTLTDGTVWQLVPVSNDSSAFVAAMPQTSYAVVVNTNVDVLYARFDLMVNLVSNPTVGSAGSFSFSPETSANAGVALIASSPATPLTVLNDVHNVLTVLSLTPTANGNQSAATSFGITITTAIDSQGISQSYNITGLDANGHVTNGYTTDIQIANPATNLVQLPGADNGQTKFFVHISLDGLGGSFTGVAGQCGACFGNLPLPIDDGTHLFPATGDPLDNSGRMRFTFTITNPNSLVLADTDLNMWLNYTVVQDAGFRSTSASAQVTWLGMRGPPEAPLAHAERGKAADFWTNLIRDQSEKEPTSSSLEQRIPLSPTAHSRPMEAMVREILSSLPQARRDEKDDMTLATLLPPSNSDEKTRHMAQKAVGSRQKAEGGAGLPSASFMVPFPASRKDAEFVLPVMSLDSANNERIEIALAQEGVPNWSRFAKGSERSKNSPLQAAHWKWIDWLEGLGGFLLLVGGPVALWDNLASAKAGLPEDNDTPERPRLAG